MPKERHLLIPYILSLGALLAPIGRAEDRVALRIECAPDFMADLVTAFTQQNAGRSPGKTADYGWCTPGLAGGSPDQARLGPLAWGALGVVVHPTNPIEDLSLPELRTIFDGRLTNWRIVGGLDRPLELQILQHRSTGAEARVGELLFGDQNHPVVAGGVHASPATLVSAVAANPNAIAVIGIDLAHPPRQLKLLSISGVTADYAGINAGTYPLYQPLYLAHDPAPDSTARGLLAFAHSAAGRRIIRARGAVPYLDAPKLSWYSPRRGKRPPD